MSSPELAPPCIYSPYDSVQRGLYSSFMLVGDEPAELSIHNGLPGHVPGNALSASGTIASAPSAAPLHLPMAATPFMMHRHCPLHDSWAGLMPAGTAASGSAPSSYWAPPTSNSILDMDFQTCPGTSAALEDADELLTRDDSMLEPLGALQPLEHDEALL